MAVMHSILSYLRYYRRAKTIYSAHSPLLFALLDNTVEDNREYYCFDEIEDIRKDLLRNSTKIEVVDLGAGSNVSQNAYRGISEIAKTSLSTPTQCQFLFRLTNWRKPKAILELGTSLGISTHYIHAAAPNAMFTTIEGSQNIHRIANKSLRKHDNPPHCVFDNFDHFLANIPKKTLYDMIYIDGNHTEEATLRYYKKLKTHLSEGGMIIFDDIYWSKGMTKAWEVIKIDTELNSTVDLYQFGLVFNTSMPLVNNNFSFIKATLKPWHLGIWG